MLILTEYKEVKHEVYDEESAWCYGNVYQILNCQSCDDVELRRRSYHEGYDDGPEVYATLYPEPVAVPEGLPKKVRDEYTKALKSRFGDANAYGVLLGRVLEAVAHDKNAQGKMLGRQLESLAKQNILPKEIINYANKLNTMRVAGAHFKVGELTAEDVPMMEKLIKAILEYVYTVPFTIKQADKTLKKFEKKKLQPVKKQTAPIPPPPINPKYSALVKALTVKPPRSLP